MKMKMLIFFVVLLFAIGIVCAGNNTTEDLEVDDGGNYIHPVSITNQGIKFDDGYTGFCIDLSKGSVSTSDKFSLGTFSNDELENNVKLAIIECYKQQKEDAIGDILSQIDDKDSNNEVLKEVFNSQEKIGDKAVVNINNESEATFHFEFLDSADEKTSDCVAYTVSLKTIETPEKLGAADNASEDDLNQTNESEAINTDKNTNDKTKASSQDNKNANDVIAAGTNTSGNQTAEENQTANTQDNTPQNQTATDNNTQVKETNKTIVNKTNTVIVNENNTTIINNNNVKTINNTNDTPENDTVSNMMKTAGNPILILIIVIAVAAVAVVLMRRKD